MRSPHRVVLPVVRRPRPARFAGGMVLALLAGWGDPAVAAPCADAELQGQVREAAGLVAQARARLALWTTAQAALQRAEAALDRGDCGAALQAAARAAELARLGLAQREREETRP